MKTYHCAPSRSALTYGHYVEVLASHIEAAAAIYEGIPGMIGFDSERFKASFWVVLKGESEPVEFEGECEDKAFVSIGDDEPLFSAELPSLNFGGGHA